MSPEANSPPVWPPAVPKKLVVLPDPVRYQRATAAALFLFNTLVFFNMSAIWHRGNGFWTSEAWQRQGVGIVFIFAVLAPLMARLAKHAGWCAIAMIPVAVGAAKMASYGAVDAWTGAFLPASADPRKVNEASLFFARVELSVYAVASHYVLLSAQRAIAGGTRYSAREKWWLALGGAGLIVHTARFADPPDPIWTIWNCVLFASLLSVIYGLYVVLSRSSWLRAVVHNHLPEFSIRAARDGEDRPQYEFARRRRTDPERILIWHDPDGSEVPLART